MTPTLAASARGRLLRQIEAQGEIVDGRLRRPARWRGQLRRESYGYERLEEVVRFIATYNSLIDEFPTRRSQKLTADLLKSLHDRTGGDGSFRFGGMRIATHRNFPAPRELDSLVDEALREANDPQANPVLASARLHVRLLAIHPFRDGNGRIARLAATLILLRAGFRSSLFLAVEQHFLHDRERYRKAFRSLQAGVLSEDDCIDELLRGMAANSMYAAWFRARENRVLGLAGDGEWLIGFEQGDEALGGEIPLSQLTSRLSDEQRNALAYQLGRLLDEEEASR